MRKDWSGWMQITKQDVMQIHYLEKEKEMWNERLRKLEEGSQVPEQKYSGTRMIGSSTEGIQEKSTISKENMKTIIARIKQKIDAEQEKCMLFISSLDNSLDRQIIEYRCIELLPWSAVARKVGGGNTSDSVRKRFDRIFDGK